MGSISLSLGNVYCNRNGPIYCYSMLMLIAVVDIEAKLVRTYMHSTPNQQGGSFTEYYV